MLLYCFETKHSPRPQPSLAPFSLGTHTDSSLFPFGPSLDNRYSSPFLVIKNTTTYQPPLLLQFRKTSLYPPHHRSAIFRTQRRRRNSHIWSQKWNIIHLGSFAGFTHAFDHSVVVSTACHNGYRAPGVVLCADLLGDGLWRGAGQERWDGGYE